MENNNTPSILCVDFGLLATSLSSFGEMIKHQFPSEKTESRIDVSVNADDQNTTEQPNPPDVTRSTKKKAVQEEGTFGKSIGSVMKFVRDRGLNSFRDNFSRFFQQHSVCFVQQLKYPTQVSDSTDETDEGFPCEDDGEGSAVDALQEQTDLNLKALPDSSDTYQGRLNSFQNANFTKKEKEFLTRFGYGFYHGTAECVECRTVNDWKREQGSPIPIPHRPLCSFNTVPPRGQRALSAGLDREQPYEQANEQEEQAARAPPTSSLPDGNDLKRDESSDDCDNRAEDETSVLSGQPVNVRQGRGKAQKRKAT